MRFILLKRIAHFFKEGSLYLNTIILLCIPFLIADSSYYHEVTCLLLNIKKSAVTDAFPVILQLLFLHFENLRYHSIHSQTLPQIHQPV